MDFKKLIFGDPKSIKEVKKIARENEAKEKYKKYIVTIDYDEIQTFSDSLEIEVYAEDEDQAEQIATDTFYKDHDDDCFEIQDSSVEEIEPEEEKDTQTLDLFRQ
jgi:hypothetical protein